MTQKHFNAILAKNNIAREVREYFNAPQGDREPIRIGYMINELKAIEEYIGEGNQPSVDSIINSERKDL